jgi:D-3-phosphoglycerate dehydrogenase
MSTVLALGYTWPDLALEAGILSAASHTVVDGRKLAPDDPQWGRAAGVLLGTAHRLGAAEIGAMPALRGIVRYGIGFDNVDIPAADAGGVVVGIIRDYCIEEVAEHALAAALSLARGLQHWDRNVREGQWRKGEKPRLRKLASLNFGIVGFGLIGRALADKARGLFGQILILDPYAAPTAEDRARGDRFVDDLATMLRDADILSVHVPLTDGTRALIGAAELAQMKPSASIVNVSRGGIVDEAALLEAVKARRLFGAALDTFVGEPLDARSPLAGEPNIILSPHVAWLSEEAEIKLRVRASEEIVKILGGTEPSTPVGRHRLARR